MKEDEMRKKRVGREKKIRYLSFPPAKVNVAFSTPASVSLAQRRSQTKHKLSMAENISLNKTTTARVHWMAFYMFK